MPNFTNPRNLHKSNRTMQNDKAPLKLLHKILEQKDLKFGNRPKLTLDLSMDKACFVKQK